MKILHVVPGLEEPTNGIARAAKRIAAEQGADLVETRDFVSSSSSNFHSKLQLASYDEIWVHSNWSLPTIRACLKVLRLKSRSDLNLRQMPALVRMPHANLDPKRMRSKGWKKLPIWWLIERRLMNRAARVVVTCEAEREWCVRAGVKAKIEVVDLKRYFRLGLGDVLNAGRYATRKIGRDLNAKPEVVSPERSESQSDAIAGVQATSRPTVSPLHVLYLGRRHPLKGVEYLEKAVSEINATAGQNVVVPSESKTRGVGTQVLPNFACAEGTCVPKIELRIVSNHFGEELEKDWEWCDVLCLPTLSENFGLVVAEALERGKRVITTDGAPAWAPEKKVEGGSLEVEQWRERLFYIKGYRDGSDETRVKLLRDAIKYFV